MASEQCGHCGGWNVELRRQITSSGINQVAWWCTECDTWSVSPPKWLPHRQLIRLDDIPIVHDYSGAMLCIICGKPAELHHWAPQTFAALFGDAWHKWPTAALCPEHHDLWHKIVTPILKGIVNVTPSR
jgi:hypothetical protein